MQYDDSKDVNSKSVEKEWDTVKALLNGNPDVKEPDRVKTAFFQVFTKALIIMKNITTLVLAVSATLSAVISVIHLFQALFWGAKYLPGAFGAVAVGLLTALILRFI